MYYWDPIGTSTEDLTNAAPGTYTLYVYDNFGCFVTYNYTVGFGVGIAQQNEQSSLVSIYPNPSAGIFTLGFNTTLGNNTTVEVVNTLGETVELVVLQKEDIQKQQVVLNLTEKANGIYYLKVKEENRTSIQKIILSK